MDSRKQSASQRKGARVRLTTESTTSFTKLDGRNSQFRSSDRSADKRQSVARPFDARRKSLAPDRRKSLAPDGRRKSIAHRRGTVIMDNFVNSDEEECPIDGDEEAMQAGEQGGKQWSQDERHDYRITCIVDRVTRPTVSSVQNAVVWSQTRRLFDDYFAGNSLVYHRPTRDVITEVGGISRHYPGPNRCVSAGEARHMTQRIRKDTAVTRQNSPRRGTESVSSDSPERRHNSARRGTKKGERSAVSNGRAKSPSPERADEKSRKSSAEKRKSSKKRGTGQERKEEEKQEAEEDFWNDDGDKKKDAPSEREVNLARLMKSTKMSELRAKQTREFMPARCQSAPLQRSDSERGKRKPQRNRFETLHYTPRKPSESFRQSGLGKINLSKG